MKFPAVLLFLLLLSGIVLAQVTEPTATPEPSASPVEETVEDPGMVFRAAVAEKDPAGRVKALQDFLEKYPEAESAAQAKELIVASRAEMGAKAVQAGNKEEGLALLKLAVTEAPSPMTDSLFTGVLLQIPNNLFFSGLREQGYEFAGLIEDKIGVNVRQILGLATFYLAVEDAGNAKRLADKAIAASPESASAYQSLGLALRLGFDLEGAEAAYSKALELDPASLVSKRSLAELKRAVGKPEEAIKLYDEIITADPSDANAGTGRTLALFDAGRTEEAESAKDTLLSINPKNIVLLVGAAYWYAANGYANKAISHANTAIAVEPRYTWAHIALARGLVEAGKPVEAERVILGALQYGNFPTLQYQLAAARLNAGFFRDAAEGLKTDFSVTEDGVQTRLGGRVEKRAENFIDLIALERKASIFEPLSADDPETADRLKKLLRFTTVLDAGSGPRAVTAAANDFVEGYDAMKVHRQIYVAGQLLDKKIALEEAEALANGAAVDADKALDVAAPAAAVLADELYESRRLALSRGSLIVVPDVPKQTLSRILRGRIEEILGWTSFSNGDSDQANLHLRRALSILPKDSAWSRSVHWKLGTVLEGQGNPSEALDNYIAGYRGGGDDAARRLVIEGLYEKLNGSLDGLEEKLDSKPKETDTKSLFLKEGAKTASDEGAKPADDAGSAAEKPAEKESLDSGKTDAGSQDVSMTSQPVDVTAPPEVNKEAGEQVKTDTEKTVDPVTAEETVTEKTGDKAAESGEKPEAAKPAERKRVSATQIDDLDQASREAMDRIDFDKPTAKPSEAAATPADQGAAQKNGAVDKAANAVPKNQAGNEQEKPAGAGAEPPANEGGTTAGAENAVPADVGAEKGNPTRPRMVPQERSRITEGSEPLKECSLVLSQDSVVITSNGGSASVLAGIEGRSGVFSLKAVSGSAEDVAVSVDSSSAEIAGKAVFVIRSISGSKGSFTVTFQSSCGSKEVRVTVR